MLDRVTLIVLLAVTMSCSLVEVTVQETQISSDIEDWNDMMDVMAPVRDGNLPIAQRLVEIAPGLNRSDHGAWQEYATEIAPKALAIYQGALKEWMNIAPNSSGDIFQYYKLKSEEFSKKITGLGNLNYAWLTNDQKLLEQAVETVSNTQKMGRQNDEFGLRIRQILNSSCERVGAPVCPYSPVIDIPIQPPELARNTPHPLSG